MSESGDHPGEQLIAKMQFSRRIWTHPYRILTLRGRQAILCLFCDWLSFNPNDVANQYCGHCHIFLGEEG